MTVQLKTMYSVCLHMAIEPVYMHLFTYVRPCTVHGIVQTTLRCGIFLQLIALLDTCTNMISRSEIRNFD